MSPLVARLVLGAAALLAFAWQGGHPAVAGLLEPAGVLAPPRPGHALDPLLAELNATPQLPRPRTIASTWEHWIVGVDGARGLDRIRHVPGVQVLRVDRGLRFAVVRAAGSTVRSLSRRSWVRYVRSRTHLVPFEAPTDPYLTGVDAGTGRPYGWHFYAVGADAALAKAPGDPGIVVGIVDSGADVSHPDLVPKIAGTNGDVTDTIGHGTFVAALAAGAGGDGVGMAGIGGASRLFIVRDNLFTDDSLASGIRTAVDSGARVINMSFGGSQESAPLLDAVEYAAEKGALLVAAAGNDLSNSPSYPALYLQPPSSAGGRSLGLVVGASDPNGNRAYFSNYGDWLSLLAPGGWTGPTCPWHGVFSAVPRNDNLIFDHIECSSVVADASGNRWGYAEGTSFSAPIAAGAAALVWSVNKELKNFQVADVLKRSARRPAGTGWAADVGWGVLDVAAAVDVAATYDSVSPVPELVSPHPVWADTAVPIAWSAIDRGHGGGTSSGIVAYEVLVRVDGGTPTVWRAATAKGRGTYGGRLGSTYAFSLRVTDGAGNVAEDKPVRVSLRTARTRIVLARRVVTTSAGGRFKLDGQLRVLTPGGKSALAGGVSVRLIAGGAGRRARVLGSARVGAGGRFSITAAGPAPGTYEAVVEFGGTKRLEPSYSRSFTLVSG